MCEVAESRASMFFKGGKEWLTMGRRWKGKAGSFFEGGLGLVRMTIFYSRDYFAGIGTHTGEWSPGGTPRQKKESKLFFTLS